MAAPLSEQAGPKKKWFRRQGVWEKPTIEPGCLVLRLPLCKQNMCRHSLWSKFFHSLLINQNHQLFEQQHLVFGVEKRQKVNTVGGLLLSGRL